MKDSTTGRTGRKPLARVAGTHQRRQVLDRRPVLFDVVEELLGLGGHRFVLLAPILVKSGISFVTIS